MGPAVTEIVRDFDVDLALVAGGCRLNVVSTTSSSNFLRFIVREELQREERISAIEVLCLLNALRPVSTNVD